MSNTDALTSKLLEVINQIQAGVVAHAPDAAGLALAAVQQDGIANIFPGIVSLIILMACLYIGIKFYKKWETKTAEEAVKDYRSQKDYSFFLAFPAVSALVGFVAFVVICSTIFCYWNYVEIFSPKVYLAHQVIEKFLN
jgi:ABC-type multidrug transport system permease subunit